MAKLLVSTRGRVNKRSALGCHGNGVFLLAMGKSMEMKVLLYQGFERIYFGLVRSLFVNG